MEVTVSQTGYEVCIAIDGHVDENGAEALRQCFEGLKLADIQDVVIDLARVTRIGSAGISQFLLLYKRLRTTSCRMRVEKVSADQLRLLKSLKLDSLFPIHG